MKQRNHYAALDGLRGVAAFSVLLYHLGHWLNKPFLASNAGLAVDFFFCLSGYVLSVAYRARLDSGMPATTFMRVRLIRLMPMVPSPSRPEKTIAVDRDPCVSASARKKTSTAARLPYS